MKGDWVPGGYRDYGFHSPEPSHMHRHFLPRIFELCGTLGGVLACWTLVAVTASPAASFSSGGAAWSELT